MRVSERIGSQVLFLTGILVFIFCGFASAQTEKQTKEAERTRLYEQADRLMKAGDYANTKATLETIVEADPSDVRAQLMLADLYKDQYQDYPSAIQWYRTAARRVPDDQKEAKAYCFQRLADAYRTIADQRNSLVYYAQSITEYQEALRYQSDDPEIWFNMGLACLGIRDKANSTAAFKKVVELDPNGEWGSKAKEAIKMASRIKSKKGR